MTYCKGIYAGCCATGCQSPCSPCERIRLGKSTVEKEMKRKDRAEHRAAMPPRKRAKPCPYKRGDPPCNCKATNQRCIREIKHRKSRAVLS